MPLNSGLRKVCSKEIQSLRRIISILAIGYMLVFISHHSVSGQDKNLLVRIAKLQIDSSHLQKYKVALREEIETSIRVEPDVLTLYAVAEKGNPSHITIFEIYSNAAAFKSHLETPHFKKYKATTQEMVKSLELMETVPIVLATKP